MSRYIGVIRNVATGEVYAVVNPDTDDELDNTRLLLLKRGATAPLQMVKVPREEYGRVMTMDQLAKLVKKMDESNK